MTKALTVAALLLFSASCNDAKKEAATEPAADSSAMAPVVADAPAPPHQYAVKATYSSAFALGDASQADKVVELWKQYDENTLDKGLNYFADTVELWMADGWKYHGTRDSLMKIMKKVRGGYSAMKGEIAAIVPLKATDLDANWVCVWGTEYSTVKNKKDSADVQENWRINKDGKIDMMQAYRRKKDVV
jgi:hypothetical protein